MEWPFSTYGETALIGAQNVAIATAVLHFSGKTVAAGLFVAALAVLGAGLFDERIVSADLLGTLMAGAGVLGVASKAPQIWTVWKEGGTGQLSAFAVSFQGSMERFDWTTDFQCRSLIISPAHCLGSSPLSKRWMTRLFFMATLRVSC